MFICFRILRSFSGCRVATLNVDKERIYFKSLVGQHKPLAVTGEDNLPFYFLIGLHPCRQDTRIPLASNLVCLHSIWTTVFKRLAFVSCSQLLKRLIDTTLAGYLIFTNDPCR